MQDELARFVASLAIPADRKPIVLAELVDHATSAAEAATREGRDPDVAAREAIGDLELLRRSLEAVEPAFRVSRWEALARGVVGGAIVAILIDRGGPLMYGVVGSIVVLAVVAACAPPRVLQLLRAELRAQRVRGALGPSVPIGPAVTYAYTVMSTPNLIWIALIVIRACGGVTDIYTPFSAIAVCVAVYGVLLVEGIRARREARA